MSVLEIEVCFPKLLKDEYVYELLKIRNILKLVGSDILKTDIISIISSKLKDKTLNEKKVIERFREQNFDAFHHNRNIKLYISTAEHNVFNQMVIKEAGFWNPKLHLFLVNLEEKLKILNSHYIDSKKQLETYFYGSDVYDIIFYTRSFLDKSRYFNFTIGGFLLFNFILVKMGAPCVMI